MTYTLIIFVLLFNEHTQIAVPGFKSEAQCVAEGKSYGAALTNDRGDPGHRMLYLAYCMPVG